MGEARSFKLGGVTFNGSPHEEETLRALHAAANKKPAPAPKPEPTLEPVHADPVQHVKHVTKGAKKK